MLVVGKRHEDLGLAQAIAQPVPLELEVLDHLRPQHAEHLGGAGDAVARHDLVGDAGAADPVVALDAERRQPVARQVGGGDQPVVAGANDDGVVA